MLTLSLPWVTKTEFLLTISIQYQLASDEKYEKYPLGDHKLIQYQLLRIIIIRTVGQTVRRITNEILEAKGLRKKQKCVIESERPCKELFFNYHTRPYTLTSFLTLKGNISWTFVTWCFENVVFKVTRSRLLINVGREENNREQKKMNASVIS